MEPAAECIRDYSRILPPEENLGINCECVDEWIRDLARRHNRRLKALRQARIRKAVIYAFFLVAIIATALYPVSGWMWIAKVVFLLMEISCVLAIGCMDDAVEIYPTIPMSPEEVIIDKELRV